MKKLITILLALTSAMIFAQDQKSLEQRAQKMIDFTANAQYDELLDYTYPKVFELVPRQALKDGLSNMTAGSGFKMVVLKENPKFNFTPIKAIDGKTYSVVEYDLYMQMVFDEPVAADEVKNTIDLFKQGMKAQDVTYTAASNSFNIKKRSLMVAIADATTKNEWTFINYDGGPLSKKIFSEQVIKELGL